MQEDYPVYYNIEPIVGRTYIFDWRWILFPRAVRAGLRAEIVGDDNVTRVVAEVVTYKRTWIPGLWQAHDILTMIEMTVPEGEAIVRALLEKNGSTAMEIRDEILNSLDIESDDVGGRPENIILSHSVNDPRVRDALIGAGAETVENLH